MLYNYDFRRNVITHAEESENKEEILKVVNDFGLTERHVRKIMQLGLGSRAITELCELWLLHVKLHIGGNDENKFA